jgi:DNA-3-methyladenine glycosylase
MEESVSRSGKLKQDFYARGARVVAQELLGKRLVRTVGATRVGGIIVETEAYCDAEAVDLGCHAAANKGRPTPRNAVMFGPPGHAYVYFTYGIHWMFNVVTGEAGKANAVLVRALEPSEGEAVMAERRQRPRAEWTNGPAKLAQALAIDGTLNGASLFADDSVIWIEEAPGNSDFEVARGPRIGLGNTPEPWYSIPWRYWLAGNRFVSR